MLPCSTVKAEPVASSGATLSQIISNGSRPDWLFWTREAGGDRKGLAFQDLLTKEGLGIATLKGFGDRTVVEIAEWEYSAIRNPTAGEDGASVSRVTHPPYGKNQYETRIVGADCWIDPTVRQSNPRDEAEAYGRISAYFNTRFSSTSAIKPVTISTNGHFFFQHYGANWGADLIASEVGESVDSTQAHIAFTRGAARQYNKPWGMDMSSWYRGYIRDWDYPVRWGGAGPNNGHSMSLTKRTYYASYMAGANFVEDEAGANNFFKNAQFELSPLGEVAKEFNKWTSTNVARGTPFVPTAILLDELHGMGMSWWDSGTSWDTFPLDLPRLFTKTLFESIWPNSFGSAIPKPVGDTSYYYESEFLVSSPFGDTFDVILETTPISVLSNYKVIIATGNLKNNPNLNAGLRAFVQAGGILVLDSSPSGEALNKSIASGIIEQSIGALSKTIASQIILGSGAIVVIKDRDQWSRVLNLIQDYVFPFTVIGEVEYLFNRSEGHWIVTLINNDGVTKQPAKNEVEDPSKAKSITIKTKSGRIEGVSSRRGDTAQRTSPDRFTVTIPAGDVSVFQFDTVSTSSLPLDPLPFKGIPTSVYSISNQYNVNAVNPVIGTLGCPSGYNSSLAFLVNANNYKTGTPDQFFLNQCWNAWTGGLYSYSNQGNANIANPFTGTQGCPIGFNSSTVLILNVSNYKTGTPDQFFLNQCSNNSTGGLYSVSNQGNVNFVNPVTGNLGCPEHYEPSIALLVNANNYKTGTPDQFFLYQCTK